MMGPGLRQVHKLTNDFFSTFQSIFADEPDEIQGIVFQPHFFIEMA